ncbi:hypothetical protein [Flavobacterium sp.]|uniref:hypothetical protein n=1 Tax=Flavobacterium sp. TaxID=239 RepID=UPI0026065F5D|nr:hypothetical protein [Flavobacterium sp.]
MPTYNDYTAAVKAKYETEKQGRYASFIDDPQRGSLKKLCELLFKAGMSISDEKIFADFFGYDTKLDKTKQLRIIEDFPVDSFRSVTDFLKNKTQSTSRKTLNLIAVLVDFTPRPHTLFQNPQQDEIKKISEKPDHKSDLQNKIDNLSDTVSKPSNLTDGPDTIIIGTPGNDTRETKKEEEEEEELKETEEQPEETKPLNTEGGSDQNNEGEDIATGIMTFIHPPVIVTPKGPNKWYLTMGALIVMVVLVWGLNKTVFTPKNCMVWMEDHYEKIDCNDPDINGYSVKLDEELLEHFRKVSYSDTLTFFNLYGKPLIWYSKSNGVYELFTYHGLHPVTEKTLKPITYTIINNLNSNPNQ